MKQQYIQKIRKECIKANPSILDLVFGCNISHKKYKPNTIGIIHSSKNNVFLVHWEKEDSKENEYTIKDFKIIGRDIHLADVLLAIENTYGFLPLIQINYLISGIPLEGGGFGEKWDLKNDSLELQPIETLEFINNLLK